MRETGGVGEVGERRKGKKRGGCDREGGTVGGRGKGRGREENETVKETRGEGRSGSEEGGKGGEDETVTKEERWDDEERE